MTESLLYINYKSMHMNDRILSNQRKITLQMEIPRVNSVI